jgi:hypothetical protein
MDVSVMGVENRMRVQEDDRKAKVKTNSGRDDSEISLHVAVHAVPTQKQLTSAVATTAAAPRFS